jgi:hypothetical protein
MFENLSKTRSCSRASSFRNVRCVSRSDAAEFEKGLQIQRRTQLITFDEMHPGQRAGTKS